MNLLQTFSIFFRNDVNFNFSRINLLFFSKYSLKLISNSNNSNVVKMLLSFSREIFFNKSTSKKKTSCWFWCAQVSKIFESNLKIRWYWQLIIFLQLFKIVILCCFYNLKNFVELHSINIVIIKSFNIVTILNNVIFLKALYYSLSLFVSFKTKQTFLKLIIN